MSLSAFGNSFPNTNSAERTDTDMNANALRRTSVYSATHLMLNVIARKITIALCGEGKAGHSRHRPFDKRIDRNRDYKVR
jgi:hypothetical protein